MKKLIVTVTAIVWTVAIGSYDAAAQSDIRIHSSDAQHSFGQRITFHLEASAPASITEIMLFFQVQGQISVTALPVAFEPSPEIVIDHVYSLAEQSLPPFATLVYWWEIRDATGQQQRSDDRLLYYDDNRYNWQGPARGQYVDTTVEVFWLKGDRVFSQHALNTAVAALDNINYELQTSVPGIIRIFIYPNEQDLRSALNLGGYNWAAGQARPELGAVLVGIPNDQLALVQAERLIPHELAHLLIYQAVGQSQDRAPPWLNEGLASVYELRPNPNHQALVEQALARAELPPLEALCAPFPMDENAARLAYAQSAAVVQYIRERFGSQAIRDLLVAYADNASCQAGVERALEMSLDGLDRAWRTTLAREGQVVPLQDDGGVWVALWLLVILAALPLVGVARKKESK